MTDLEDLQKDVQTFVQNRDWEQYHSPKNLAMALSVETSELVEEFQWKTDEESYQLDTEELESVKSEIGDVFIYLLMISEKFDLNPVEAAREKLETNKARYPVEQAKGSASKYTEYQHE